MLGELKIGDLKINEFLKSDSEIEKEITDYQGQIYTGCFHFIKRFLPFLFKPYFKKISKGIDSVYPKISSKNGIFLKSLIGDMEKLDRDNGRSTFWALMTRKAFYLFFLKFALCQYEYDQFYRERADYLLKRIKEQEFYFDDTADPVNWYPDRPFRLWMDSLRNR